MLGVDYSGFFCADDIIQSLDACGLSPVAQIAVLRDLSDTLDTKQFDGKNAYNEMHKRITKLRKAKHLR